MDTTPVSACALRRRLWSLFNVYSTVVSNSDGVSEVTESRRLEASRYHSCLSAFARLSSFRNLFVGSEDDIAIRAAATQLQSKLTQELLWREAVGREAICAGQQGSLNPLETKSTGGAGLGSGDRADENMHREACDNFEAVSNGTDSTPSDGVGAADDAKGSISWDTFHSVIVLYLYDVHCFHRSFLTSDVDALRSSSGEGREMRAGPEGARVEKQANVTAMMRLAQRKATCAVNVAPAGEVEAVELSSLHRHIDVVIDGEGVDGGQPFFYASASVSASSSSCPASTKVIEVAPREAAVAARHRLLASPSPRRPAGDMEEFGDKPSAASSTPPVARFLKLRPQSPSQQNVMADRPHAKATHQPFEYPRRKHRTRHDDEAAPVRAVANRRSQGHRTYTTRRPQAPKPASTANVAPELKAQEGGAGGAAWAGRPEHSCDVKPPPTALHEECFCGAGESASLLPMRLEREQVGEPPGSGGYAEGRHTTAFAVEVLRRTSAEASSGSGLSQPLWARETPLVKPSPSRSASGMAQDLEDAANDEAQPPPTQTSRRRSSLHHVMQSSPFPIGEPLAPLSLEEERHSAAAAAAQAMVLPVRHATAPSPTPTPREDDWSARWHSEVYREASTAAPAPPLHQFTVMQQVAQRRPRQPQPQHRPLRPLSPQQLIGMPCILSPSYTPSVAENRGSRVPEMGQQHRSQIPAPTPTYPMAPTMIPSASREAAHRLLVGAPKMESAVMDEDMRTPTRCQPLGPQGLKCCTPMNAVSPVTRQPTAALSLALATAPHHQQHVDGRSPPPRLSSRARIRSMSRGSRPPLTPPRVPSTRILISPSGSVQATTPPSVSYPT
ncbi:hypothetical protein LSCM4_02441 [Leishmania orientalis]|uniref:Uncharacterized protein n=1 Tax=Leishmania orientalis TaxID=2249476 RepID=A0A836H2A2_9TRYP|nr:hypothetical protein LSCM4_02441 [Leishmania orientalis]